MQEDCVNCGGDADGRYDVELDGAAALGDAPLCSGCAAELDAESFIAVARRVSAVDRNR